jgi:hypothetical protein
MSYKIMTVQPRLMVYRIEQWRNEQAENRFPVTVDKSYKKQLEDILLYIFYVNLGS